MADLISSVAIFPDWGSDKETNKMATRIFPVMSFFWFGDRINNAIIYSVTSIHRPCISSVDSDVF